MNCKSFLYFKCIMLSPCNYGVDMWVSLSRKEHVTQRFSVISPVAIHNWQLNSRGVSRSLLLIFVVTNPPNSVLNCKLSPLPLFVFHTLLAIASLTHFVVFVKPGSIEQARLGFICLFHFCSIPSKS